MKNLRKKWMLLVASVMLLLVGIVDMKVPVYASMADEAIDYTMGETYRGKGDRSNYYSFTLNKKSYISLNVSSFEGSPNFYIYNTNGKKFLIPENVSYQENVTTGEWKGTASRTFMPGTYYLEVYGNYNSSTAYYFNLKQESPIKLSRGKITSLKSKKRGQATVSCQSVPNAIGYKIQYSTDYRFRKGVKTIYSPTRTRTLKNLKKGKRYYVKVIPYTVYSNGDYVWGGTSYVKSVAVKR